MRRKLGIHKPIITGDKVKLNIKAIRSQQDYPKNLSPQYVKWVNTNTKKHYTVAANENGICRLTKDDEEAPWTFWEGHLQHIKERRR